MADTRGESERRQFNRLAAVKLAIQILDRKTELSPFQQRLVGIALTAVDGLADELMERWRAEHPTGKGERLPH